MYIPPTGLLQKLYPRRLWRAEPGAPPCLYLTFDDGPSPKVTEKVLDLLEHYGAQATFFCIGEKVQKAPALFQRLRDSGHRLGHHTMNHLKGWETADEIYLENARSAAALVGGRLFRPPYGKIKASQARTVLKWNWKIVMWDVLSLDYRQELSPDFCWQRVKKQSRNGSIIVFHDSEKAAPRMLYALEHTLQHFRGWDFKALAS